MRRWGSLAAVCAAFAAFAAFAVLLAIAGPAAADLRKGALSYRHGAERPRLEYRVFWGVVDESTVRTTRVMMRVVNPERPASSRNWVSLTVLVGGVHPGMGERSWDGRADWSAIAPGLVSAEREEVSTRGATGATVVWSCELFLGSGSWKTRYVPVEVRCSERYETWLRVRFHAPGRAQYWFRLTSPLG
jgi:hypothetical protein